MKRRAVVAHKQKDRVSIPVIPRRARWSAPDADCLVAERFAALMRDRVADQLRLGGRLMGAFVVGAIVLGWLLYALPL